MPVGLSRLSLFGLLFCFAVVVLPGCGRSTGTTEVTEEAKSLYDEAGKNAEATGKAALAEEGR
ncbi:hypothetical protein SAMN06265222_103126 [Neorhodopirellula lusitana]|uniref:Secreted protein n=2 Tax=Neorhodopirellula lusitana TaxID=445327 RepID=A0ABY1PZK1_9BACT|nr:hypothetical protein SAMN06265222_103126 [Neorhodopirellula lusitana]